MTDQITSRGHRWIVRVNGHAIHNWRNCEVGMDLADLCGIFRFDFVDEVPKDNTYRRSVALHDSVEIEIESVVVFRGHVEAINGSGDQGSLHLTASGRDKTGDLVDCSANPCGPAEYRKILLETVVGHLSQPFGISVDQDVATGAPFTLVALEPSDTVLGAIERLSRQRGVLVTSDGISGLRLTQAGKTRARDRLVYPGGNVDRIEFHELQRHSDTWVKGQFNSVLRGAEAVLNVAKAPGSVGSTTGHTAKELAASARFGHAVDPGVPRYRPIAHLAKSQSGGSAATQNAANPSLDTAAQGNADSIPAGGGYRATSPRKRRARTPGRTDDTPWTLQDQADWRMRTARAHATAFVYIVPGLLNAADELWRPNQLVPVNDLVNAIDGDMLIGAVTWVATDRDYETRISVVPPDAYDLSGDADAPAHHGRRTTAHGRAWDGSR